MKKIVTLSVMLIILVGLVVGYVFLSDSQKEGDALQTGDEEVPTIQVHKLEGETLKSIEYVYEGEKVSLAVVDGKWIVKDDPEFPFDDSYVDYMIDCLSDVRANRLVAENLDNQSEYGLDVPTLEIKYQTSEGNEYTYTIGMYNEIAEGFYFKSSVVDKVYISGRVVYDSFALGKLDMTMPDDIPTTTAENITEVEYVVDGKKHVITTDKSGADFFADPFKYFTFDENGKKIAVDGQAGASFMVAVAGATKEYVKGYKVDKETLDSYGLGDNKALALTVKFEEEIKDDSSGTSVTVKKKDSYTIYIGKSVDEEGKTVYYSMFDNSDILYGLNKGDELYKALEADFKTDLVCPLNSNDTDYFKVEYDGAVHSFDPEKNGEDEKFIDVFYGITALSKTGYTEEEKTELVFKAIFGLKDGEVVLNFYKHDEDNYALSIGEYDGILVSAEKVEKVIAALK